LNSFGAKLLFVFADVGKQSFGPQD